MWVPGAWPVTLFQAGIFSLAMIAVVRDRNVPFAFALPLLPLALGVAIGALQWATGGSVYTHETQAETVKWATFCAVFVAARHILRERDGSRWIRQFMAWFGFLLALLAILEIFTSEGKVFWLFPTTSNPVLGTILYRNHYAAFMEAVLPIALYESFRERRNGLLYCAMAATMYASVLATGSRMGVLLTTAEVAGVVTLLWYRRRDTDEPLAAPLWRGALLGAAFVLVVGYGTVWTRFQTENATVIRLPYAVATIEMIASHPWAGTGLGTWPIVYPRYAAVDTGTRANRAHNDWLQWTSEGGVVLGAAMLFLFAWCLRPAIRSVWGLGLFAVFLHAAVDYPFSRPALGGWFILLLATLSLWWEKQAEKRKV